VCKTCPCHVIVPQVYRRARVVKRGRNYGIKCIKRPVGHLSMVGVVGL